MTDERKYREDEIHKIFDLASSGHEVGPHTSSEEEGLTLAELQEVGLEVGLAPERIARAATALDSRGDAIPRRSYLGMPISVGRIVELPRDVTDREWEMLVSELRETFGARGQVTSHGGLREWSNGNLHAFLEPTETGYRLRMTTFKGNVLPVTAMGVGGLVMGLVFLAIFALEGRLADPALLLPLMFAVIGAGALASNLLRLPGWAREREEQMEYIAGRVSQLISAPPSGEE